MYLSDDGVGQLWEVAAVAVDVDVDEGWPGKGVLAELRVRKPLGLAWKKLLVNNIMIGLARYLYHPLKFPVVRC